MCSDRSGTPKGARVSPFGYPRIKAWSAAPRGFSQPPTSFIGGRRQGIHRWLFVAWKNKDARARYAILKKRIRRSDEMRSRQPAHGGCLDLRQCSLLQNRREGYSTECSTFGSCVLTTCENGSLLRKEVIQPHLP